MIKKITLALIYLFVLVYPVSAQDNLADTGTDWTVLYQSDFSNLQQTDWPIGVTTTGTSIVQYAITEQRYHWQITSPDGQFSWLGTPAVTFSADTQIAFSAAIALPYFSPSICGGLLLGDPADADSFYTFLLCNDSTYGLYRYQEGNWIQAIPFTALTTFEQGQANRVRVEINHGWADFYLEDSLLDTYNLSGQPASLGLYAQPLSAEATDLYFSDIRIEEAPAKAETLSIGADVPDAIARTLRVLEQKDRISGMAGTYQTFADQELSLAQMGFYQVSNFGVSGQDVLLQADIAWNSAFDKPDYKNSGCGFVFRAENEYTFLRAYIALDGNIYLSAFRNGTEIPIFTYNYGSWSLTGQGTLTIVANAAKISVLFNQNLLGTVYNATWMATGGAGLTVLSGTNLDYGTACSFTNGQMYLFE